MSYIVLARKWRPNTFDQIVGQNHAVTAISNALNNDQVHHAWLLTGTRGVGKTTLARVFTKALNCEKGVSANPCNECSICKAIDEGRFVDLLEVDAASKTGVESTRELLENINYSPSIGRFKVYLIDEVHMFSNASFNALLKTLEEPPSHVKFLLATTDPQKLPVTILSRCLQLKLSRVSTENISNNLKNILKKEKIKFEEQAIELISHAADGSIRDSLSLLDQSIALGNKEVTNSTVREMMGLSAENHLFYALEALAHKDGERLLKEIRTMVSSSSQFNSLLALWLDCFHHLALYKQIGTSSLENGRVSNKDQLEKIAEQFSAEEIHLLYHMILISIEDIKRSPNPGNSFEMLILRLLAFRPQTNNDKEVQNSSEKLEYHSESLKKK